MRRGGAGFLWYHYTAHARVRALVLHCCGPLLNASSRKRVPRALGLAWLAAHIFLMHFFLAFCNTAACLFV